jgi:hypothetical protein
MTRERTIGLLLSGPLVEEPMEAFASRRSLHMEPTPVSAKQSTTSRNCKPSTRHCRGQISFNWQVPLLSNWPVVRIFQCDTAESMSRARASAHMKATFRTLFRHSALQVMPRQPSLNGIEQHANRSTTTIIVVGFAMILIWLMGTHTHTLSPMY